MPTKLTIMKTLYYVLRRFKRTRIRMEDGRGKLELAQVRFNQLEENTMIRNSSPKVSVSQLKDF